MEIIQGGVTAAKGFMAASTAAGIKYKDRKDMAMVFSESPCTTAAVYTSNIVKAAPVLWDKNITKGTGPVHAIVINAGIANACTGKQGYEYCEKTATAAQETLKIPKESVLVASTGVIGKQLPIDRIVNGTKKLASEIKPGLEAGDAAAKAIMTTDTIDKQVAVTFMVGDKLVTIGAMCKGSGMIHPNMCTMLGFIATDAVISKELLQEALSEDVKDTFNMISVDGDTSTNDTLAILANGMAMNQAIDTKNEDYEHFKEALHYVNETLAKKMAGDGEGATALIEVQVINAITKEGAKKLAKSVITSSLTKAAIYGHDANWGRIMCAMGYAGVEFDPEKVNVYFAGGGKKIQICSNGLDAEYSEDEATAILSNPEVTIIADLQMGKENATAWGCDLTYDYVKINADYRS